MSNVNRVNSTNAPVANGTGLKSGAMRGAPQQNYWATNGVVPSAAGSVAALAMQSTPTAPAAGFEFARVPGSALTSSYGDYMQLADDCEIKGGSDRQHFNNAMNQLQSASARPALAAPGQQPGQAQLKLTAADIAAIQAAPTPEAAKMEVLKAISRQTGIPVDQLNPTSAGKKGNRPAREALNALLGTHVKDGREKNAGSAVLLDAICDSVASSIRAVTPQQAVAAGMQGPGPQGANRRAGQANKEFNFPEPPAGTPPPASATQPNAPTQGGQEVVVNLGDYVQPAGEIGELQSPLIFDLVGLGLKIKQGDLIDIDVDGDGKKEIITNLDAGMGLLVFDSQCKVRGDTGAGRDYFGDKTDLSHYGIVSRNLDKTWNNGFDALRALCEHFELVRKDKQFVDAADLAFLEKEVGLRMRIDGVRGHDRTFAELGITRINLGDPKKVQSIKEATTDAYGNKLMKQAGATFVMKGKTRDYADLWFNVQARAKTSPAVGTQMKASNLAGGMARRM